MTGLLEQENMDNVYLYVCIVSEAVSLKLPQKIFEGSCKHEKICRLENFLTSEKGRHLFRPEDYNFIANKAGLLYPLHSGAMLKTILHEKHAHTLFRKMIIQHLIEPFCDVNKMRIFYHSIKTPKRI